MRQYETVNVDPSVHTIPREQPNTGSKMHLRIAATLVVAMACIVVLAMAGPSNDLEVHVQGAEAQGTTLYWEHIFCEDKYVKAMSLGSFMHITDTHADPFYDIDYLWCGKDKLSRPVKWQDNGKPIPDVCNNNKEVAPQCPSFAQTPKDLYDFWLKRHADGVKPAGRLCPCGVFDTNPPFELLYHAKRAIQEYAHRGGKTVIYTGDFGSHNEPGTFMKNCNTAKAVLLSNMNMFNDVRDQNGKRIDHLYVLGNNDVIPKKHPLSEEWLHEVGDHMLNLGWLNQAEHETWRQGGFYKRPWRKGLCAIALNSNLWTPTQINETMAKRQLEWLPTALVPDGNCSKFLIVSHIAVGAMAESAYGSPPANNSAELWNAEKSDPTMWQPVRDVLNNASSSIVAEVNGDKNKEFYYLTSANTWGYTAVGMSRRGTNDPGLQITLLNDEHTKVKDILSYLMHGRNCSMRFSHSFVEAYAPYFDNGIDATSVHAALLDRDLDIVRERNSSPSDGHVTATMMENATYLEGCRSGKVQCC